jgi:hypothetical protein
VWSAAAVPVKSGATPSPTQEGGIQGNFGRYLYTVTPQKSEHKLLAQYDPTLPPEDNVVLGALRELAKTGYGLVLAEDVQPVVENLDETNYVTFQVGQQKIYFELFRNTGGQVGSVRFWKQ